MKTPISTMFFLLAMIAIADDTFSIGGETYSLEFEKSGYSESIRTFIAEDVERVFAPLGSITNVADISLFTTNTTTSIPLTHYELYPENFYGGISVSNEHNTIVFRMNERLSEKYRDIYNNYESISNQFAQLSALLASIADNSITNRTDTEIVSLIFLPSESTASTSPQEVRAFFHELHDLDHLTVSILDFWNESLLGETYLMAGAKTAVRDGTELFFSPVLWIFHGGAWKFYHPAIMETVPNDE